MMIERNEFRIQFGKMKEAKAIWLDIINALKPEINSKIRMITDLTGPAYTLVIESERKDFMELILAQEKWKVNSRVTDLYQQFIKICQSSERILYHLEYEG